MSAASIAALVASGRRIEIKLDGNCGCALLGDDLQTGEAEFVEIVHLPDDHVTGRNAERQAAFKAMWLLMERLGITRQTHSYFLGAGLSL